ncbi:MAG: BatD family protein, partial [Bacteroidales bacterium]|nr:BatD family protein [Bacteroidales bacterium]
MKRIFEILILIILFSGESYSQKLTASANETQVYINSQFQVTFSLTGGQAESFNPPSFKGFQVMGQSSSSGGGMTIIVNGKVVQGGGGEQQWIYFLVPASAGKFTIDPASATINGKKVQSNSLTIEVVNSGSKISKQQNQTNQNIPEVKDKDIFVRAFVNKTNHLQGEQIIVTYKIYTRVPISQYTIDKLSQYTGFWSQDLLKENERVKQSNETINGVTYVVAEIRKVALFPQKSGTLTIAPLELECLAQIKTRTRRNDPFADFFKDPFFSNFPDPFAESYQNVKKKLKSNALTVNVKPLPSENKPDDFKGTVGIFSFSSQIDKTKLKTNEAANLKFTISGTGNIKLIEKPTISFPPDLETYDPKVNDNINITMSGISGSKTFEYLVIPRSAGTFKIKSVSFSYFDLSKNKYITFASPEYTLEVEKGSANEPGVVVRGVNKEDLKYLGSDIQFIKNQKFTLTPVGIYFYNSLNFYLLLIIPFLLFVVFVIMNRKRIKENSN